MTNKFFIKYNSVVRRVEYTLKVILNAAPNTIYEGAFDIQKIKEYFSSVNKRKWPHEM